jgi:hypothetical protein
LTPVTGLLVGEDGLVSNVLSAADGLLGGGHDGGLLSGVTETVEGVLDVSSALTPVTGLLSGVTDALNVATAPEAVHEGGAGSDGNIVSDLLSPVTDTLHDVGGTVANVVTTAVDGGSGLISGLVSTATSVLGGAQDAGAATADAALAAGTGAADDGGLLPGVPATTTAALQGSDAGEATHAAAVAATPPAEDHSALPGVGDVLDLGSSLVGVIVPALGFIGQPHFEAEDHHDLGNSHGSLLHMLV